MKVAMINNQTDGSTGKITKMLCQAIIRNGDEAKLYYTGKTEGKESFCVRYSSRKAVKINALKSRMSGNYGFLSQSATKELIDLLEKDQPDLIHIHNIHGHDCDFSMLMRYIKEKQIPVVYTLHDTWAFTGYCAAYDWVKCTKWKQYCHDCPQKKSFTWFFDHSKQNQEKKIHAIKALSNITFVTPSQWMSTQIQESPLKGVKSVVIPNGIDTTIFQPSHVNVKEKLQITGKYMLLSVAFSVSGAKGLNDLMEIRKLLPNEYVFVLVGLPETMIEKLPEGMIGIPRTANQEELAQYYSSADVLVNPTHQDNFPTVNLEALACGTPIVSYRIGGAYEAFDEQTGIAVKEYDYQAMADAIMQITKKKNEIKDLCRTRALNLYKEDQFVNQYLKLYQEVINEEA